MKRLLTILGKISAIVVLALAGIFVLIGGPCSVAHRIQFDRFVSSVDAEYFMDEAIALIKQHNNYIGYNRRGDEYNSPFSDLPPFFANMNARWMSVESNYLRIEFHGGFDHYGFHVREMDGEWILWWYTEGGREIMTTRVVENNAANKPMQPTGDTRACDFGEGRR